MLYPGSVDQPNPLLAARLGGKMMLISSQQWLEQGRSFDLTSEELTPLSTNASLSPASVNNQALVMNLRFEENFGLQAIDSSSNGTNPGYLINGASFGNLNDPHQGVIRLDGLNDYLRVASSSDLNQTAQAQRSVSLWWRADNLNSGQKQVLYEEGGASRGISIYIDQGKLYAGMWVANQWVNFLSTSTIESNRWHHVALVLNVPNDATTPQAEALRAYVDGREIGRASGGVLPIHNNGIGIGAINSQTRFHDGAATGTGSQAFGGSLDDLRVYNRALSDSEIAALVGEYNSPPVANNDTDETEKNTPLTLLAMNLLANDRDADAGDVLSLVEVSNAINGSVSLNNQGNVVFTPTTNFQGTASFEYTISDQLGATATATVEVRVTPGPGPNPLVYKIGNNLARIGVTATQSPFLDAFKSSSPWIWASSTPTETLNLDENGWVKSLPASGEVLADLWTTKNFSLTGRYVVLYEGEGTITYALGATKNEALSTPGRDVIDVHLENGTDLLANGIDLVITETDPNQNGNYIRNIAVVPESDETTYQTQIFTPEFLEKIAPFDTLRFMDWGRTNNSTQIEWSDRATLSDARWSDTTNASLDPMGALVNVIGVGAPVEIMVELANRTQANPWFNIPHMANNQYVTNFAQYVKEHLDPSLTIYVEYSNEVWNTGFQQYRWVSQQARKQWPDSPLSNYELAINWFSQRSTQVMQIWDGVFDTDKERVLGVVNTHSSNPKVAERVLSYEWDPNPKSHEEYGIDALAIAPYFGRYLGVTDWESQVESWTQDADGGLNKLFDELTEGGVLINDKGKPVVAGGAVQQAYNNISKHTQIAQREDLLLLGTESGQHLVETGQPKDNETLMNLFIAANRDPRMGEIYKQYFQKWFELGGDLINHYNDIRSHDEFGSWGALEYLAQTSSPKYDALLDLINGNV